MVLLIELGVVEAGLLAAVVEHLLAAVERVPFGVAVIGPGGDHPDRIGHGDGGLHPGHLPQRPG